MGDLVQGYQRPARADGWLPGQAGALLPGGARPEHITATLVDLAVRRHLMIDAGDDAGWQLTRLPVQPDRLVRNEKLLLRAVFGHARTSRLPELPKSRRKAVGRVHQLLTRDVVRHATIRLRTFRDQLRVAPLTWRSQPSYLPCVIAFGLGPQRAEHMQGAEFTLDRRGAGVVVGGCSGRTVTWEAITAAGTMAATAVVVIITAMVTTTMAVGESAIAQPAHLVNQTHSHARRGTRPRNWATYSPPATKDRESSPAASLWCVLRDRELYALLAPDWRTRNP
jgi:hypothetical protein